MSDDEIANLLIDALYSLNENRDWITYVEGLDDTTDRDQRLTERKAGRRLILRRVKYIVNQIEDLN